MNLKKILASLALSFGVVVGAAAQNLDHHASTSFLNNCQWLVLATNSTIQYNYTNVTYELPITPNGWSNFLSLNTNLNGNIIPQWEKDVNYLPDGQANICSNYSLAIYFNSTNLLLETKPGGQFPLAPLYWYNTNGAFIYGAITNVFTNAYGIISSNVVNYYPVPPIIPAATSTNAITMVFQKELIPGVYGTLTNGSDLFIWSVTNASGLVPVCVSTNLPSSFLTSSSKIRLLSITSGVGVGTSTGSLINDIRLIGWNP